MECLDVALTGLGTGHSLDSVGLEDFSSQRDFGILFVCALVLTEIHRTLPSVFCGCSIPAAGTQSCSCSTPGLAMDFLTLFLIYLGLVLAVTALLCLCSGRKENFLTRSINRASQVKHRASSRVNFQGNGHVLFW